MKSPIFLRNFMKKTLISLLILAVTGNRYSKKQHFYLHGTKWNKSGQIEKARESATLQKKNKLWIREWGRGRKCPKKKRQKEKERERQALGQKVCLWCDSFLCRTRVSFCWNVCHQLGLVTRCVCVFVYLFESMSESALHIPSTLDKNSIRSF